MFALISISNSKNKKFDILLFQDGIQIKKLSFGDSRYEDFTQHHDEIRKMLYDSRHKKLEDWDDPFTKGFWSKHLLWNKETLRESADDIEHNYSIPIYFI